MNRHVTDRDIKVYLKINCNYFNAINFFYHSSKGQIFYSS